MAKKKRVHFARREGSGEGAHGTEKIIGPHSGNPLERNAKERGLQRGAKRTTKRVRRRVAKRTTKR
jgi:hypothetical protein